jgi:alkylation response protein AidB-like acyl-CoA dehydrogenase
MTPRQRELVGIARELGRDWFAPRAAQHDREASFPMANYADLRDVGFLGLCVPERFGGIGADFATYCLVSAELGTWCGATALTFNMHSCSMLWPGQMADAVQMTSGEREAHGRRIGGIYERVVRDGVIFAQPFSEPNAAAAAGRAPFETVARAVPGGWRVSGRKHFASLSGAAHYYSLMCTEERPGEPLDRRNTAFLAVPADAAGFRIEGEWDTLGMRATVSKSLVLDEVFVPEELALLPSGAYFRVVTAWPHMFFALAPTYLGIARAAFQFTVDYLRQAQTRSSAVKQLAVAEMRLKLEQAEALFAQVIAEAAPNPDKAIRLRVYAAHYTIMEHANDICRLAIRTCGGRSIARSLPLERLYRDSRCGSLMLPWTAEICLERLGRESLYESGERDA